MRFTELTEDNGTYVAANFDEDSVNALTELQERIGVPNPVLPDDFHTTIVYSKVHIDWEPITHDTTAHAVGYRVFGDEKRILVLELECESLTYRFDEAMESGATYDFPEYIPHVTLSYDIGDFDVDSLEAPSFDLIVTTEFVDDIK